METLSAAFCDDDPVFRSLLRETAEAAFRRFGAAADLTETGSAEELFAALGLRSFDLIFLDIDLPGLDGIAFGERLRAQGCRSDIIYVSNMDDKVYESFRAHPWSFVRKSRFAQELPAVIGEYVRARRVPADRLLLPGASGETLTVDPPALVYVEASGKTQKLVFAAGGPASVRASLRDLEAELAPRGFLRIHKGFLVNYRYIKKITSRCVLLDTGGELPVGRDRLRAARERYLALMKWKGMSRAEDR